MAQHVERAVEGVDADVDERAAAIGGLGGEGAPGGDAGLAEHGGAGEVGRAEATASDELVGALGITAEAGLEVDGEDASGPVGGIGHGLGFGGVHGHGFFAEDVLAGFEGRDGGFGVGEGRGADGHHINVIAGEQVAVVGVGVGDVEVAGELSGAARHGIGRSHDVDVWLGGEAGLVGASGNAAGADDAGAERLRGTRHRGLAVGRADAGVLDGEEFAADGGVVEHWSQRCPEGLAVRIGGHTVPGGFEVGRAFECEFDDQGGMSTAAANHDAAQGPVK